MQKKLIHNLDVSTHVATFEAHFILLLLALFAFLQDFKIFITTLAIVPREELYWRLLALGTP
jgi:hypothetical protein